METILEDPPRRETIRQMGIKQIPELSSHYIPENLPREVAGTEGKCSTKINFDFRTGGSNAYFAARGREISKPVSSLGGGR